MYYIELVAILAVLQFLFFGAMTGKARRASGLKAPAMTGEEQFERMYRVQMNTQEVLVAFLPALFIAGQYQNPILVGSIGSIYIAGRFIYWQAYVRQPSSRTLGFMLSIIPTLTLGALALFSVVSALLVEI